MTYILDSNIFIQAQNDYYCLDVCPGFWDFLDNKFKAGEIVSITNVYDELKKKDDDVFSWVQSRKEFFGKTEDRDTQINYAEIANHVTKFYSKKQQNNPHIKRFLDVADPWIIAKARSINAIVVSHEIRGKDKNNPKPKIPEICDHFGITTIRTKELLRELQVKFIMESKL
ncbi:DUF4411 family protein [Yersinia intermedia]|uniref:DUF4411 family protein n=1 Tax=Yersinia intermedia TaxID=631 RepID=UPI002AC3EE59|nr:DUF4411 family protein [Yersinia enterocolitica]HEN3664322.1 DUF4411 family protein [Yersinia enterocolitica]